MSNKLQHLRETIGRYQHFLPHAAAWLVVTLLITASWLHVCSLIEADRTRTIANTERDLANLTRVTQEHTERTLRSADQALSFVKARYEAVGDALDLKALTQQGVIDTDIFNQVGVIDADGIYKLSNLPINGRIDLSDREHFKVHLTADTKALFISRPVLGRASDKWSLQLTRRINRKDGSFGGVAVVSLDPAYFTRFYGDLNLGRGGVAALIGMDGIIRARRAGNKESFDINAPSATVFARIVQGRDSGAFTARSVVDGVERSFFFRRVTPYPIVVTAGIASTDVFAAHLQFRNMLLWQAASASLLLLVLGIAFSCHHQQILREMRMRKQAAELLASSEERMQLALDGADMGLWDWHIPSGKFTHNARMATMLGYPADTSDVDSHLFASLLHPDDWPAFKAALYSHLKGETARFQVTHRLRHRDQRWISLMARGKVVERDAHGRALRMIGTDLDITQQALAEQQLRIAAAAFESQEGMFVTNTDQVIQRVNHAFTQITGYSAAEAIGQTPGLLSSGRHNAAFYTALHDSIAQHGSWKGEIWNRRKNGEVYPQWLTITAVKNSAGAVSHYVSTLTDITIQKAAENEIRHLAFYDPLTLLPNRRLLLDRLRQALAANERSGHQGALLFVDLDNFKAVNDTLGHDKGDLLLQQVAQRLTLCVRERDTVARLGGDEFVVMLEDLNALPHEAANQVKTIGEKILAALNQTYLLAGHVYHNTPSIGVSLFNQRQNNVDALLKQADLAMYEAKTAGRNTLRFFDPGMQAGVTARATLEADLDQALQEQQFQLYYQPQAGADGCLTGAEALLRWQHPQRGLILPAEFIPAAEESGLILPLGQWVLETACAQLKNWSAREETAHLTLSINISARQLHQPDFVAQVLAALEQSGANPERLRLELTESMLQKNMESTIGKMRLLKEHGVHFALDDFGAGDSALSHLKRLPLDQLKIDLSLVRNALLDPGDAIITAAIVALARALGLNVIAEGVETEQQRDFLASQGCLAYQGYLFGKPLSSAEFERLLQPCVA